MKLVYTLMDERGGGGLTSLSFKKIFFLFFILLSYEVLAYIPSYSTLLKKLARQQGNGTYLIEQQLSFSGLSADILEKWHIDRRQRLRVDVFFENAKKPTLRFLYIKKNKFFKDQKGRLKQVRISPYHLERPFHLRSAEDLAALFFSWKTAPVRFLSPRKPGQAVDSFIKLARRQKVVQYEIGRKPAGGRLWIEQDEFVIREWFWPFGASLTAYEYKIHPGSLFFPSQRQFKWSMQEVLMNVKTVKKLPSNKKLFQKSKLIKNVFPQSAYSDTIREFYKKFR